MCEWTMHKRLYVSFPMKKNVCVFMHGKMFVCDGHVNK